MSLTIRLKVVDDQTGKVEIDRESHSWTQHILEFLWLHWWSVWTGANVTDTGGTPRAIGSYSSTDLDLTIAAGTDTQGIVVGTGVGAESISSNALGTKTAHGTGANQLSYGACSLIEPTISGSTVTWGAARTFTNSSTTNPITVQEIGMYVIIGSNSYIFCIARDLTGGVAIANGGASKTVTYTFVLTN